MNEQPMCAERDETFLLDMDARWYRFTILSRIILGMIVLSFMFVVAPMFSAIQFTEDPEERDAIAILSAVWIFLLTGYFYHLIHNRPRGRLRIDEDGYEWIGPHGRSQRLKWEDVLAVRWCDDPPLIRTADGKASLWVPGRFFGLGRREAIRAIRAQLARRFPLSKALQMQTSSSRPDLLAAFVVVLYVVGAILTISHVITHYPEFPIAFLIILLLSVFLSAVLVSILWNLDHFQWHRRAVDQPAPTEPESIPTLNEHAQQHR